MIELGIFDVKNNIVGFNKWKLITREYKNLSKDTFDDVVYYFSNDDELYEYEVNYVAKHQLLEIIHKEQIDHSEYDWMEGLEISPNYQNRELERIASYGSKEAYESSFESSKDAYLLELDYMLSKLTLGVEQ